MCIRDRLYTEHGAIAVTFIFLAIDDSTLTAIDIGNAIRSNRFEAFTNRRVSADYKLPDPPEGLRELNDQ